MKTSRHRVYLLGAWLFLCGSWGEAFAQDDSLPLEAPPPPMDSIDHHPAELQTEAQSRALAQALYSRALRTEMAEGFAGALPQYLNVLKADPHFIDLQVKIAFYYLREHDAGRAMELLQRAQEANPKSGQLLAAIAFLQQTGGHLDLALASARSALVLEPASVLGHRVQFEVLRDMGRIPEALANARAASHLSCTNVEVWMELARTYTELICASADLSKDEVSSIITPLYDRAFALGEPTSGFLAQRGEFVSFLGKKEEALKYFTEASQKGEPSADLYVRVARLQSDLGRNKEAIKSYEAAYELAPEQPLLREQLAFQYVLDNQEAKAIPLLEAILHESPTRSGIYVALGDLYSKAKQLDKAEQNYREAIVLDQTNFSHYLRLANVYLMQKRLQEAANTMAEAREKFPASAQVAFYAAIVQRELKNSQQALDLFAQAKILADEKEKEFPYVNYFYQLSLAQEEAGRPQQSEESLKSGLNLDPNNEDLLNALAYLWAQQGKNLPEALKYSRRSLQISPGKPEFLDTMGWIYFKLGKYDDARVLLEKAVSQVDGQEDEVLDHLAEVYAQLGQTRQALETFDKILAKSPDNTVIREKYEKLKKGAPLAQSPSTTVRD